MIIGSLGLIIILVLTWGVIHFYKKSDGSVREQLLTDLGLGKSASEKSEAPYYKWGWSPGTDERVWGKRIVTLAFQKAKLWLSTDDALFFKESCNCYAAGQAVDEKLIHERIEKILKRSDEITNCATAQVKRIFQDVASLSDAEAAQHLKEQGLHAKSGKAQYQLGVLRFRRMMTKAGEEILGLHSNGMAVNNEEGELLFMLKGMDGWDHWLKSCREEVQRVNVSRSPSSNPSLLRLLKAHILTTILKSFENDIASSQKFLSSFEQEIQQGDLNLSIKRIEKLESFFYHWQFSEGIPFNSQDHSNICNLLSRKDLAPHFRHIIIDAITTDHLSIHNLGTKFPNKVMFYGKNPHARSFASQQYMAHLDILIKSLASSSKETYSPGLIVVTAKQIGDVREYGDQLEEILKRKRKDDEPEPRRDYLPELLDQQKHLSIVERNIDDRTGELWGWIVDIDLDEFTPKEYAHLDKGAYRSFVRFLCDGHGDIDFTSQSNHAKQKRVQYFKMILDNLVKLPSL